MRCLVIDDSPDDRALVERLLRERGHRTTCAASAAAGLALIEQGLFDVAIVDLGMPGMSGAEALRALRARDGRLRLLVVSGFGDKRHILEALEAGADGYIVKDELAERLPGALQDVFAGKSPLSARVGTVLLRYFAARRAEERAAAPGPPAVEEAASREVEIEADPPDCDVAGEIEIQSVTLVRGGEA
jgi:DNA-binding NarL/FixJ family response regulator